MKNLRVFSVDKSIIKRNIHKLISILLKKFGLRITFLEVNIVNSDYVLDLNKKYLKHNYNTDILTFNYSTDSSNLEGEIYISLEDAKKNSQRFNCTLNEELKRLITHGILHLIGFDDTTKSQKIKMKKMENESLKLFQDLTIIN